MHTGTIANRSGPGRRSGFQFCKQGAAQVKVRLLAFEFEQAFIGFTIAIGILVGDSSEELVDDFGSLRYARSEFEPAFEFTKVFLELQKSEFLVARLENGKQCIGHRTVNARQLALRTNDGWLFGEELVPAEGKVFESLLQREPGVFLPVQTLFDGVAELQQRFLDLLTHLC